MSATHQNAKVNGNVPRHFKVEPQYNWNVLQVPAEAVMTSWVRATARRVWVATMVMD